MQIVKSIFTRKYYVVDSQGNRLTRKLKIRNVFSNDVIFVIELKDYTQLIFFKQSERQAQTNKGDCFFRAFELNSDYFYYSTVDNKKKRKDYICYKTGEVVLEGVKPDELIANGLIAAFDDSTQLCGYLDTNMQWKILPKYVWSSRFNANGYAIVRTAEREYTVINKEGENAFNPIKCSGMQFLHNSYVSVVNCTNYKKGVIDIHGNQILDYTYDDIIGKTGYFILKKDGKYGISDCNGNIKYDCEHINFRVGLNRNEIVLTKEETINVESLKG